VFTGKVALADAVLPAPGGFSVLLAGSGLVEYSRLTPELREKFLEVIREVAPRYDRVLLDTGAGISDVVLYAVSLADDVAVVATPEPTSLTDAYAAIKVLALQQQRRVMQLVVNQASRPGEGRGIRGQLQLVADRYVDNGTGTPLRLDLLGDVPLDAAVRESVQRRQLLLEAFPGSPAAQAIGAIAEKLAASR
jgi:flagellar biosynthesis protein FlhG